MGSLVSHLKDKEEDYRFYCKELNIEPLYAFSIHADWVEKLYRKETTLTYLEYDTYMHKKALEQELAQLRVFFSNKEAELLKKIAEL